MADENEKKDEEEVLIPVGEGLEEDESHDSEEKESKKKADKKVEEPDDDADEDEEDEEAGDKRLGATDEDDEAKAARRDEKKSRRQRQKEARERNQREISFLRQRNEALERRFSELDQRVGASEASQIDARINHIKSNIKAADRIMAKALEAQDGDRFSEAQSIRDDLKTSLGKMETYKETVTAQAAGNKDVPPFISHAGTWMQENDWWEPQGTDKDSRTVSRIDKKLVEEGYDPNASGYWKELTKRVHKALPHRASDHVDEDEDDEDEDTPSKKEKKGKRSKGPRFSTGGRERPLKPNEVYINPERKQAMIDAGVWDDPKLRQRYLKQYRDYDKQHANNA